MDKAINNVLIVRMLLKLFFIVNFFQELLGVFLELLPHFSMHSFPSLVPEGAD